MRIIDVKVRRNLSKYIFQCILAGLTVLAVLIFLNVLTQTAIIAALGASAFIVFTMPNTYSSDPRRLIGGYFVGIIVGCILYYTSINFASSLSFLTETNSLIFFGAISVVIAIFIMTITNTEHAPAAGIALGLVINQWDYYTILLLVGAIFWMAGVKRLLQPHLMNLTSPKENNVKKT